MFAYAPKQTAAGAHRDQSGQRSRTVIGGALSPRGALRFQTSTRSSLASALHGSTMAKPSRRRIDPCGAELRTFAAACQSARSSAQLDATATMTSVDV